MRIHLLLLAVALGCASPRDRSGPDASNPLFPHASGYEDGALHGAQAINQGSAACLACHSGASATSPPCSTCHALYPHDPEIVRGTVHGPLVAEDGIETCDACHAEPTLLASQRSACTSCHASYPHPEGWEEDAGHGQYTLARGSAVAACGNCHGTELTGGELGASSCMKCHETWPHPDGWEEPTNHGAAARADMDACEGCHGVGGAGGGSGVPCSRCHAAYPHADGWNHLTTAGLLGEGTCLACHAAGDGPSTVLVTCATQCHGGAR